LYYSGPNVIYDVEEARDVLNKVSSYIKAIEIYNSLPIKSKNELEVTGKEILTTLDKKPGPWLGELLSFLEKKVVLNEVNNNQIDLLDTAKKWEDK